MTILSDTYDNNRRKGLPVSETHTTAPVFPPGRYGRRRDGRRRLGVPITFGVLVLAFCIFLTVRLYSGVGNPDYDPRIVGWSDVTETSMTIKFTVRVPAGTSASCVIRARSYDGAEVGRGTVTVTAPAGSVTAEGNEPLTTTARASHGDVVRCNPA